MKHSKLLKVLFIAGFAFIFCGNYFMTDASIYGTVKILTVTDYYGGNCSYGSVYITQNGSAFIATRLYNGPGEATIQAHITGNLDDYYVNGICTAESGTPEIYIPGPENPDKRLRSGNRIDLTVCTNSGTSSTYCVADVWQWQQ